VEEDETAIQQGGLAYREEYQVERSLTPMYLHYDQPASGLIQVLSLGDASGPCWMASSTETGPQRRNTNGVVAGNPTRATAEPTTELMLFVFK